MNKSKWHFEKNKQKELADEQLVIVNYEKIARLLPIPENRKTATPENARWFMRASYITLSKDAEFAKSANSLLVLAKKLS